MRRCTNCGAPAATWRGATSGHVYRYRWCRDCLRMILKTAGAALVADLVARAVGLLL